MVAIFYAKNNEAIGQLKLTDRLFQNYLNNSHSSAIDGDECMMFNDKFVTTEIFNLSHSIITVKYSIDALNIIHYLRFFSTKKLKFNRKTS